MATTEDIIKQSSFIIHEGRFIYTKVNKAPLVDNHFLLSKDQDEITVVTKEENIEQLKWVDEKDLKEYDLNHATKWLFGKMNIV